MHLKIDEIVTIDEEYWRVLRFNRKRCFVGQKVAFSDDNNIIIKSVPYADIEKYKHEKRPEVWFVDWDTIHKIDEPNNLVFGNFGRASLGVKISSPYTHLDNFILKHHFRKKFTYYYWDNGYHPYDQKLCDIFYFLHYYCFYNHVEVTLPPPNDKFKYRINLDTMKQMNHNTGRVRRILEYPYGKPYNHQQLRAPISESIATKQQFNEKYLRNVQFPSYWYEVCPNFVPDISTKPQICEIDKNSELFSQIQVTLNQTCENKLIRARCVINPQIFANYQRFVDLAKFDKRSENFMGEVYAYHGTSEIDAIVREGFKYSFNRNGDFGQGNYFSLSAEYSLQQYASRHDENAPENSRTLLMCRVFVGNYVTATFETKGAGPTFRSSVNSLHDPFIICTFDNAQSCLDFLVDIICV